jgi:uncharacterized protein YceK
MKVSYLLVFLLLSMALVLSGCGRGDRNSSPTVPAISDVYARLQAPQSFHLNGGYRVFVAFFQPGMAILPGLLLSR